MLIKTIGTPDAIVSLPSSGEYKIVKLKLDADKKIVVVYDETPEP